MKFLRPCQILSLGAAVAASFGAQADSLASSASSAGSASSGSVSDSFKGSSNSSSRGDKKEAADYRIIEVAAAPDREGIARITMQDGDAQQRLVLDLPRAIVEKERLLPGDMVRKRDRVYGYEFARGDTNQAFYLVLADEWNDGLAARPVRPASL